MFPPPIKKGNCGGDLSYAKQRAKEERKWLLVNLQALDNFQSHQLNRDTWSDETIQALLESSFIFWQRSSASEAGRQYLNLYRVAPEDLPEIAIIGPTGIKLFSHSGFLPPAELSGMVLEFLEQNSLDSKDAPKMRQRKRSTSGGEDLALPVPSSTASAQRTDLADELGLSAEDLELERALQMSMAAAEPLGDERGDAEGSPTPDLAQSEEEQALSSEKGAAATHLPPGFKDTLRNEPEKGVPNTTRLQLRLADGRTLVRRFFLDDKIAAIYAVVCAEVEEASSRAFTLQPPMNSLELLSVADSTLEDCDLTNSKIIMRWV
uniref:UBX domain-containing protein n=1 Tax=Rhizochromulina marina TaxID=1034831 RepID=A0A7S2WDF0_9STRA